MKKERPGDPYLSINNPDLTEEQRRMYESVLATWKPEVLPKQERPEKRYDCPHCFKEFKNYQNLYLHTTRVHSTSDSAVTCDICNKTFKNKHYLHMHKSNLHYTETEPQVCQFCNQEFRSKKSLEYHLRRAHEDLLPELHCSECHIEFSTLGKLRSHMNRSHTKIKYECDICKKSLKNSLSFDKHLRTQHKEVERHSCVFCPLTFKTKHHMKRHVLNVHPPLESKVACPECSKEFKNAQYLNKHMQIHTTLEKKVPCDLCDKLFHSKLRLHKHKKVVHPSDDKKVRCETCGREFAHLQYLRRHFDAVHLNVDKNEWSYQCQLCSKKFKLDKYLKLHLLRHERQKTRKLTRKAKIKLDESVKPNVKKGRNRLEIEFIKCEPVTSSESGSGTETELDSE